MIGIDEVGRGAWAGPLLVCAARLVKDIDGLKDSKQLTRIQRKLLVPKIKRCAVIGYGWVSADEIDDIGLGAALKFAAIKALEDIGYENREEIIIDGTINFVPDLKVKTLPKADFLIPTVSAASIAAKVARDNLMIALAKQYPHYGFENHVGYGTRNHLNAIKTYGYCRYHRRSFKIQELNKLIPIGDYQ